MALYNILRKSDVVLVGNGPTAQPARAGTVRLVEPGAGENGTQITAYKDSGLVTPHTQPIRLSAGGRANIWVTRDCDMYVYDRNGNLIVEELNANPEATSAEESGGLINNGSFEVDSDANDEPDFWDRTDEAGSANTIDTTTSTDGAQSFKFVSSGTGGGDLRTSDFFPVNDADDLKVNFDIISSVATVRNIVRVEWYDVSQVSISNTDVYDSTANPLTWTANNLSATPPAGARFAKLKIIGCEATGSAGSTNFDRVSVFYPAIVSGVFDNITVQNNEIITTNTNGDLAITPNGTGAVNIGSGGTVDLTDAKNDLNIGSATPAASPHMAFDANSIQTKSDGTTATDLNINALGGNTSIGPTSGSGNVTLYYNTAPFLVGTSLGVQIRPNSGVTAQMLLQDFAGNDVGQVQHDGTDLYLYNYSHGNRVILRSEDAGGTGQNILSGDPDDSTILYAAGTARLYVATSGTVLQRRDDNVDTSANNYQWQHADGTLRGFVGYNGDGVLNLQNRVHGDAVLLSGEDAGGIARNLIYGDPDGKTDIYYNGTVAVNSHLRGIEIRDTAGTFSSIFAYDNTATRQWYLQSSTDFYIAHEVHGGSIILQAEDAGGTARTLINADPDDAVTLYFNGSAVFHTGSTGFTFGDNGTRGNISTTATGMVINQNDNSPMYLQVSGTNGIQIEYAAGVKMFYNGSQVVQVGQYGTWHKAAGSTGVQLGGSGGGYGEIGVNVAFTAVSSSHNYGVTDTASLIRGQAGGWEFYGASSGTGGNPITWETLADFNRGGSVQLYYAGTVAMATTVEGVDIYDTSGSNPVQYFRADSSASLALIGAATTDLTIRALTNSATVNIQGYNSVGALQNLIAASPDNVVGLYYAGTVAFRTNSTGGIIYSTTNDNPELLFYQDDVVTRAGYITFATTGLFIENEAHGTPVTILAEDAGGTDRNLIVADPDSDVILYYNGTATARTVAASSGGLEANNTSTGSGFERVLTESDITANIATVAPTSEVDVTNSTTYVDTGLTISGLGTGYYLATFNIPFYYVSTSVAASSKWRLTGTNIQATSPYGIWSLPTNDNYYTSRVEGANEVTHTMTTNTAANVMFIQVTVGFRVTTSTGTIKVQFAQSSASASQTVRFYPTHNPAATVIRCGDL